MLDILEAFWNARGPLHGYVIKKITRRSGPTVYNNLDRLAHAGWIAGAWEENPLGGLPSRCSYRLTSEGRIAAGEILARSGRICHGSLGTVRS
jgi:PadR family transcriptional regulator, regulatory protein PadR